MTKPFLYQDFDEALKCFKELFKTQNAYTCLFGDSGTGKTMLLRTIQQTLDEKHFWIIYCAHAGVSPYSLIRVMADELHVSIRGTHAETARCIVHTLKKIPAKIILCIDEAHCIRRDTLNEIRILAESELQNGPLFSVIFSALPAFNELLHEPQLFPMKRRISTCVTLNGLIMDELIPFISHVSGKEWASKFSNEATIVAFENLRGIPALIQKANHLCMRQFQNNKTITKQNILDIIDSM
jgi:type II secretory pathway predicted ATPase ExeA